MPIGSIESGRSTSTAAELRDAEFKHATDPRATLETWQKIADPLAMSDKEVMKFKLAATQYEKRRVDGYYNDTPEGEKARLDKIVAQISGLQEPEMKLMDAGGEIIEVDTKEKTEVSVKLPPEAQLIKSLEDEDLLRLDVDRSESEMKDIFRAAQACEQIDTDLYMELDAKTRSAYKAILASYSDYEDKAVAA